MGCFPDWPDFSENDAEEFIKILINHKNDYRKKDSRHIRAIQIP
jgi:hypothetical protein